MLHFDDYSSSRRTRFDSFCRRKNDRLLSSPLLPVWNTASSLFCKMQCNCNTFQIQDLEKICDPPAWPGWQYRRHWTLAVRRWNKATDVPLYRRAEKVLRSLGWELQADFNHLSEEDLLADSNLDQILAVLDSKAGVRDGDERRKIYKAALVIRTSRTSRCCWRARTLIPTSWLRH